MSNTPSDAEIWELIPDEWAMTVTHAPGVKALVLCNVEDFAREVLAKWGTPQPVVREPLTDEQIKELIEDGVFLGNCKEIVRAIERAHGIAQKGGSNAE